MANFRCWHCVVLVSFCILCQCNLHLIALWFLQALWLQEWSIQLPSFLAFYVSKGHAGRTRGSLKYFLKNALLSFFRNMKSAVHAPYAGWLTLSCSALACTHDFKNFLSSMFCCKTFTMLCYDASYRCLSEQSSISSPLHHLSYRRLSVPVCLQAPVSLFSCFGTSLSTSG